MQHAFHTTTTWERVHKKINLTKQKEPVCQLFKEPIYMSDIFMSASGLLPNVILSFSCNDVTAMPTSKLSLSCFGIHQVIVVRCHDCMAKTEWQKTCSIFNKILYSLRGEFGEERKKSEVIRCSQPDPTRSLLAREQTSVEEQRWGVIGPISFWLP